MRAPTGTSAKHLLKAACGDLIPTALLHRPKTGFTLPIDRWMRGPMREACSAAIEAVAGCGLLEPAAVRRVWRSFDEPDSPVRWTRPMALIALGSYLQRCRRAVV